MLEKSLVENSRVQDSGRTHSMTFDDVRSQPLTVHGEHDQSDVTMTEKIADVKPKISEIIIVNESNACELPEDTIALRYHYNEAKAMECDQSDVTILGRNEDVKLEINEIVLENEGDICKLLHEDTKQDINTTIHDYIKSNETKSMECNNSVMSIEVKNVFSLCKNIGDRKV